MIKSCSAIAATASRPTASTVAGTAAAFKAHAFSEENNGNTKPDYAVGLRGDAWDVIEFTDLDVERGDLEKATNGSELLKYATCNFKRRPIRPTATGVGPTDG